MADQLTFGDLDWAIKGKITRREKFLTEMDAALPWATLLALIEPHYPIAGNGRRPMELERMLRIHFLQHWFDLSDPGVEEALYDSRAMQHFVRLTLGVDPVPDETTICKFRHLLEQHELPAQFFAATRALLEARGLLVKRGTIVDATLIAAPSSTKNAEKARDPEMRQTKKGNQWYFGMKVHVGTDPEGMVHSLTVTDAATADITQLPELVHGEERALWGDRAYDRAADREQCRREGVRYLVNRRSTAGKPLSDYWRRVNRSRSRVRARVEHVFQVVKRLWGFRKVRYRGLAKNRARAYTAFTLANVYRRRHALGAVSP